MVMTARFVLCLLLCWNLREEDGGAPLRWLDWLASLASGIAGFGCQAWDVQTAWRQTQCKAMVWSVWWKSHLKRFGKTFSVSSLVVRGIKLEMNHHGARCAPTQKKLPNWKNNFCFFSPAICIYLIFQDQNLGFSFFFFKVFFNKKIFRIMVSQSWRYNMPPAGGFTFSQSWFGRS